MSQQRWTNGKDVALLDTVAEACDCCGNAFGDGDTARSTSILDTCVWCVREVLNDRPTPPPPERGVQG